MSEKSGFSSVVMAAFTRANRLSGGSMRIAAAASSSIVRAWTAVGRWPREDVEKRQREVLLGKAQKVRN